FSFNHSHATYIYTHSLHDALPISMVFNLGEVPKRAYPGKAPGTRMATAGLIRNALTSAANFNTKRAAAKEDSPPDHNLKLEALGDRKSTRLNSSHECISYAMFCLK